MAGLSRAVGNRALVSMDVQLEGRRIFRVEQEVRHAGSRVDITAPVKALHTVVNATEVEVVDGCRRRGREENAVNHVHD